MEEPSERLIRRALGRWPPPTLGPTLPDDVLRRLAEERPPAGRRKSAWPWLTASWLVATGASVAVLAHLPWSEGTRAVAWGFALALVPLAYSAALWPDRALELLVLWGRPLVGGPPLEPRAVRPGSPAGRLGQTQQ